MISINMIYLVTRNIIDSSQMEIHSFFLLSENIERIKSVETEIIPEPGELEVILAERNFREPLDERLISSLADSI